MTPEAEVGERAGDAMLLVLKRKEGVTTQECRQWSREARNGKERESSLESGRKI